MQEMPWVLTLALVSAGRSIAARIAMMAMTTSNSMRVKALGPLRETMALQRAWWQNRRMLKVTIRGRCFLAIQTNAFRYEDLTITRAAAIRTMAASNSQTTLMIAIP